MFLKFMLGSLYRRRPLGGNGMSMAAKYECKTDPLLVS